MPSTFVVVKVPRWVSDWSHSVLESKWRTRPTPVRFVIANAAELSISKSNSHGMPMKFSTFFKQVLKVNA